MSVKTLYLLNWIVLMLVCLGLVRIAILTLLLFYQRGESPLGCRTTQMLIGNRIDSSPTILIRSL